MKKIQFSLILFLLMLPVHVYADTFTGLEIRTMNQAGVKISMEGEEKQPPYIVPLDMSPARMAQAEVLDLKGIPLYDIPSWFSKFTNLRNLNLTNTRIDMDDLLRLGNISRLEVLYLNKNALFGATDAESLEKYQRFFAKMPNIRYLYLESTGLSGDSAVSLGHLKRLRTLDLKHNRLKRLDKLEISGLSFLKTLHLDGNPLNDELRQNTPCFENFPHESLEVLSLSDCGIYGSALSGPVNMPELRSLDLSDNYIEAFPFLGDLPSLEILNLSKNPRYKSSSSDRVEMNERYGGLFVFQNLKQLKVDDNAEVPDALLASIAKRIPAVAMEFVRIPAGSFTRDSGGNVKQTVTISKPFYLGKHEITQAQWEAVMGTNPSRFKHKPNNPVENVSWNDVQEFIRKLNQKENTDKYRLPTEAEWEYAARAGSTTAYCFGDDEDQLEKYAWYDKNAEGKTHPVGQRQPNNWGLYDMHGNVEEWVQDWYGSYPGGELTDPEGPPTGGFRVNRGGSWYFSAGHCRSAYRGNYSPGNRYSRVGFRLAFSPGRQ